MLSVETSSLLKSLLVAIASGEMSIEKQRKALGILAKFEPYSAFQRIDRKRTGFVDSMDLLNFLRDNGFKEETEADTYYLVRFFDVDNDEKLNYTEFLTMLLPCDNSKLRNEIVLRPNYYVGLLDYLPKTIEYEMCKLLVKEIAFHRRTEKLKQELAWKADFDSKAGFKAIDDWTYHYIDFSNLKRFMKSTGYVPTNKELAAIIRRLDLNADSRLSYEEFEEGIRPAEPYSRVLLGPCTKSTKLKKNMKKSKITKKSLRSSSRSKLQRPKTAKSTMKIYSKYNSRKSKPRYQRSKNKKSLSR
jgi:Ca2+-binding EF-hand superfamily protein